MQDPGKQVSDIAEVCSYDKVVSDKSEAWLYHNPEALASVRRGLQQAAEGKTISLGSFKQYTK